MPRAPKGEKRPADVIGAAVQVMKIATGEVEKDYQTEDNNNIPEKATKVRQKRRRTHDS